MKDKPCVRHNNPSRQPTEENKYVCSKCGWYRKATPAEKICEGAE